MDSVAGRVQQFIDHGVSFWCILQVSGSISASTPACHAGERGSTPRQRDSFFFLVPPTSKNRPCFSLAIRITDMFFSLFLPPGRHHGLALNHPHALTSTVVKSSPHTTSESGRDRSSALTNNSFMMFVTFLTICCIAIFTAGLGLYHFIPALICDRWQGEEPTFCMRAADRGRRAR